jgi:hypothetical protein
MPEFYGLQIEARCVKCGKLPTVETALLEMQNHLYLCQHCWQQEEAQGRNIAWTAAAGPVASEGPRRAISHLRKTRDLTRLPADSIFALLELPLHASIEQISVALEQKMATLLRESGGKEQRARLLEWQDKLLDEEEFEHYRQSLQPAPQEEGALVVGGRAVFTIEEFLAACEGSQEGWADGERYLRSGQLRQWLLFTLDEPDLSKQAYIYQKWNDASNFRALNALLYIIAPGRPFRLYREDTWISLSEVSSVTTSLELAHFCDQSEALGEQHLYQGSMIGWLENSQGIDGLKEYYEQNIAMYAILGPERAVGLELLLEKAVPTLSRPRLVVTFDGQPDSCAIGPWDREIAHRPIMVRITNIARGYVSLQVELSSVRGREIGWLMLDSPDLKSGSSVRMTRVYRMAGRQGVEAPFQLMLVPRALPRLGRGRTYRCELVIRQSGEGGKHQERVYPITLKTMNMFQGLCGKFWLWGLRGGPPGLVWNLISGLLFAWLTTRFLSVPLLLRYLSWQPIASTPVTPATVVDAALAGMMQTVVYGFGNLFVWLVAGFAGFLGFWIGRGKGHLHYPPKRNATMFRTTSFWLLLLALGIQLVRDQGWAVIGEAFQRNYPLWTLLACYRGLGDLLLGGLIFVVIWLISLIHFFLEKFLRRYYREFLTPEGAL